MTLKYQTRGETCPQCHAWALVVKTMERKSTDIYRRYICGNNHRFSVTTKLEDE